MADKNNNILSVINGNKKSGVRDPVSQNSLTEDLMDDLKVATWYWHSSTDTSTWSPAQPDWLPASALTSLGAFLLHVNAQDKKFFQNAILDNTQSAFEAQLRIRGVDQNEVWVHVNGRREADNPDEVVLAVRDVSATKSLQNTLQQQIRRHQDMIRDTEAISFEFDLPDWDVRHIDQQIEALLGFPTADWLRRKSFIKEIVFTEDWHNFMQFTDNVDELTNRASFDFRIKHANGELRWFRFSGRLIAGGAHSHVKARGIFQDISETRMAIEAHHVSEQQLHILYDQNPSMFFSMDPSGVVLSINRYGAEHLGYRPEELIGVQSLKLHLPSQRHAVKEHFDECVAADGDVHHWETCLVRKDNSPLWVRVAARMTGDQKNGVILIVCEDITETRALSDKLEYQSRYDLLTGLSNRTSFELNLSDALTSAKEHHWEHVLCYFDLDQFKIINDTCGHSAGDQMLRRVGRMLSKYLREEDVLARLGGDEFGILFYRCDLANARRRAEEINNFLASQRFRWGENSFRLTASVGVVAVTDRAKSTEQLLSIADTACYAAKDMGRNRVYCYEEEDDVEITRRHGEMSWVARLQVALDGDGFEIYSQTIKPLDDNEDSKISLEILLRLKGYEGDVILPERFIRAAENYHIATRIDSWVCEHVVDYFELHPASLESIDFVCVNLSAQSVTDNEFQVRLMKLLEGKHDIANNLCFEITETGVIENIDAATQFIKALKSLGCRFALDDFGSGVSSFAYLKNLEVDIVKIDGMFVKHMVGDPIDRALVGSINEIGHAMGKRTIAEFVEDEDTQRCLKQLGVDYAQGFHIHKPEPLTDQLLAINAAAELLA